MSETALTPEVALVLLWHWTQTPSPEVPTWCREHPAWPRNFNPADLRLGHLIRAAKPLVETIEAALRAARKKGSRDA